MTKILQILLIIYFGGTFFSCHTDNKVRFLDKAEECLEEYPDSAIRILEKIANFSFEFDSQRARFALLWTQTSHKCHKTLGNDSLINIAVDYYTRQKDSPRAARSFLYKGLVHKQRKEVEKAVEAFAMSEQWFEGVEDDQYKALLYNHYGALMLREENFKDALHYLKKSYQFKLKGDSIHYVVSACGAIANTFELLGKMDSAKVYFEKGLQYKDQIPVRRYFLFLQNYANFLRQNKEYHQAENILRECLLYITGEERYSIYSSFATLYYETKNYAKSLEYANMMLDSQDSLMLRGCYLHLYRGYNQLEIESKATVYRELYLKYHSGITNRLKTTEISQIPHQTQVKFLQMENNQKESILWNLTVCIILILLLGFYLYFKIQKQHKRKEHILEKELKDERKSHEDDKIELQKSEQKNIELENKNNWDNGNMKFLLSRKNKYIGNIITQLLTEKNKVRERDNTINQLERNKDAIKKEYLKLEEEKNEISKKNRKLQKIVDEAEHNKRIERQIEAYSLKSAHEKSIVLLKQLKYGKTFVGKMPIPEKEYSSLITNLLEAEYPGMISRINQQTTNKVKRLMCYLIVLGLDDDQIMYRATNVQSDTIRRYRKECLQIVNELRGEGC